MKAPAYRICRKCRLTWNVSVLDPSGKIYICPQCKAKRKGPIRSKPTKAPADEAQPNPKGTSPL